MYHLLHTVASITKAIVNLIENKKGKLRVIFNHNAKRIAIDKHDQLRRRLIINSKQRFLFKILNCSVQDFQHYFVGCLNLAIPLMEVYGGPMLFDSKFLA